MAPRGDSRLGLAVTAAATAGGRALGAATAVVSAVRPSAKPLHPRGLMWSATLVRHGGAGTGATWLDEPGRHRVLVRRSRAAGLPPRWPDVHGLALRVHLDTGPADLLLATTGSGSVTRFVLVPGRRPDALFYGSLLPYRSPAGPLHLAALTADGRTWGLSWAARGGPWTPYGVLRLVRGQPDRLVSFDPVLNPLPGLSQYDALARLRLPA